MEDMVINGEPVAEAIADDPFSQTRLFKQDVATAAKKRKRVKQNVMGWLFSMWPFVGYCLFGLIPFALSIVLSMAELHNFDITEFTFVGFANYKWIFTDPKGEFWFSLRQTLYYCLSLPIGIVLGMGTAVLLTRHVKLTKLFRTILFIPNVCSVVGVSMMWKLVFNEQYGVINTIIAACGGKHINFLGDEHWFMPIIIFTTTWGAGAGSILFQAALEQVNRSLIEAAEIDGASSTKIFFNVTLPAISPTTFYVLTMNTIGALQAMANIQVLANDGKRPLDSKTGNSVALTAVYFIYWMAFNDPYQYGLGKASAAAWILAILIVIVTRINFKLGDYWVCYDN